MLFRSSVVRPSLTTISSAAAIALAKRKGELFLNGLATISDEIAALFSDYQGGLYLDGVSTLSDATATALSCRSGHITSLRGLTILSHAAAKTMSKTTRSGCMTRKVNDFISAVVNGYSELQDGGETSKANCTSRSVEQWHTVTTTSKNRIDDEILKWCGLQESWGACNTVKHRSFFDTVLRLCDSARIERGTDYYSASDSLTVTTNNPKRLKREIRSRVQRILLNPSQF